MIENQSNSYTLLPLNKLKFNSTTTTNSKNQAELELEVEESERLLSKDLEESIKSEEDYIPPRKRKRYIFLFISLCIGLLILSRNFNYSSTSTSSSSKTSTKTMSIPRPQGPISVGYFTNWGIYARNYKPNSIPLNHLSHLLYAFANIKPNGEVYLSDSWADVEIRHEGDTDSDDKNLHGNFKSIYLLKKANRTLKLLLSIGGYSFSSSFAAPLSTSQGRNIFVQSCLTLVEDLGLDGLDLDWEYPKNDQEAQNYVEILRLLREGLDQLAFKKGLRLEDGFELSVAAPCGKENYQILRLTEMDRYLSFWNLMAYDYSGSWDKTVGHQAALFSPPNSPNSPSTHSAIQYYLSKGINSRKLIMGIPLYGRSFLTSNGIGSNFNGVGKGSFEEGIYDFKDLPPSSSSSSNNNIQLQEDLNQSITSSYQTLTEFISFDNENVVRTKINYINQNQLGGIMFWELSGDKLINQGSLVQIAKEGLGQLDQRLNHLDFKESKYSNIRNGME